MMVNKGSRAPAGCERSIWPYPGQSELPAVPVILRSQAPPQLLLDGKKGCAAENWEGVNSPANNVGILGVGGQPSHRSLNAVSQKAILSSIQRM